MCRNMEKKPVYATIATTAATIQQNMYKYANTRKMSRLGNVSGMLKTETDVVDARKTVYAAVKT